MESRPWGVELPSFKRPDGRTSSLQLRPPTCELGVLKNANGSARFKMGLTSALAAVFGPKESNSSRRSDKGSLQVVVRPLFGNKTLTERYAESCLKSTLSAVIELGQLIRTKIVIVIQPEEDDGGLLSCFINSAMCAILDAGIPCKSTYLSVPLIHPSNTTDNNYTLDPTTDEIKSYGQSTCMSFTLDIHSGSLVQTTPEIFLSPQFQGIPIDIEESSWAKHWSSTVEILHASGACCRILAEIVRGALELRLSTMVVKTITANNLMRKTDEQ